MKLAIMPIKKVKNIICFKDNIKKGNYSAHTAGGFILPVTLHFRIFANVQHNKGMDHQFTDDQQERIDIVRHKLKFVENKPLVLCIEALEPLTARGADISQLIAIAGGVPVTVNGQPLQAGGADVIILMLAGQSVQQSMGAMAGFVQQPVFSDLKAIKNNRLYIIDAIRYADGQPASVVELTEMLAEIIHPKQFIFGYEGSGWIKFAL